MKGLAIFLAGYLAGGVVVATNLRRRQQTPEPRLTEADRRILRDQIPPPGPSEHDQRSVTEYRSVWDRVIG